MHRASDSEYGKRAEGRRFARLGVLAALMLFAIATPRHSRGAEPVDYVRQIKPILKQHCYACHGAIKQKGGLRLDTAQSAKRGGDTGAAIKAGDLDGSLLYQAVTGEAGFSMPPEGEGTPLNPAELELVKRWIMQGADSPQQEEPAEDPRRFWSYQLPRKSKPGKVDAPWNENPIDEFLHAERVKRNLTPRPPAPPAVQLRRLYLDLIGLPPTREELRRFLADPSDAAYARAVDDLLSRPQYGERWGRHWMDVWRYSDWYGSRGGNEIRYSQRHIWRWRDWIVDSMNEDKPYDRMIVEMLAGDEADPGNEKVVRATGFLGRNWYKFDRNVWMFETVEQTSQAFLALTMRCCRCHDHKYDPITHEEYYRFRAFFEPHDVLTEPIAGATATVKDSKLGEVLKDGLSRVYDKQLDAPTYRFVRGDGRSPDKSQKLQPGVPASLGGDPIKIEQVALPPESFYPALRPGLARSLIDAVKQKIDKQGELIESARAKLKKADAVLAAAEKKGEPTDAGDNREFLSELFDSEAPKRWTILSGQWKFEPGKLTESQVATFATVVSKENHPRDFRAKVRYRTLKPGTYRSVGFSYDYRDKGRSSQDIYTATGDSSQSVQAFHRKDGRQFYPAAGIVRTPIKLGEETTVEIEVRGQQLKIWLNGELKLEYLMPEPRADGKFSLWVHQGSAEFHEVTIRAVETTIADLRRQRLAARQAIQVEEKKREIIELELASLKARMLAERAKYELGSGKDLAAQANKLAMDASSSESAIKLGQAELELLRVEQKLAVLQLSAKPATPEAKTPAVVAAMKEAAAAEAKVKSAEQAVAQPSGKYAAVGEMYPRVSTGRRLALARWIASRRNPRTARVAVNHLWLRHFGSALTPTVANFGLNGKKPTHPELLDWLAVELMDGGWRMKPLHRLMVLSRSYRMSSADGQEGAKAREIDGDNVFFWRMNSRRMEAESVRDSVLYLGGSLDLTRGGPEIPETQGDQVLRRSMYFRLTPNEKMKILELFDVADPNSCYRRRTSVVPQQALALTNSKLSLDQALKLSDRLDKAHKAPPDFVEAAFETVLSRPPTSEETSTCVEFLGSQRATSKKQDEAAARRRARANLVHVLLNHNDFVTIR